MFLVEGMRRLVKRVLVAFKFHVFFTCVVFNFCFLTHVSYGVEGDVSFSQDSYLESVAKEFSEIFRNSRVLGAKEAEIDGLYAIFLLGRDDEIRVVYFYPKKRLLFLGEIWTIDGTSLTGERIFEFEKELKGF